MWQSQNAQRTHGAKEDDVEVLFPGIIGSFMRWLRRQRDVAKKKGRTQMFLARP
jgi:hypothetical protein